MLGRDKWKIGTKLLKNAQFPKALKGIFNVCP